MVALQNTEIRNFVNIILNKLYENLVGENRRLTYVIIFHLDTRKHSTYPKYIFERNSSTIIIERIKAHEG